MEAIGTKQRADLRKRFTSQKKTSKKKTHPIKGRGKIKLQVELNLFFQSRQGKKSRGKKDAKLRVRPLEHTWVAGRGAAGPGGTGGEDSAWLPLED